MSQLQLYRPTDAPSEQTPTILPFRAAAARMQADHVFDVVVRARAEHKNRVCQCCGRVTVEPIELADGVISRNGSVVPGTATLIGFRCSACEQRWSA